MSEAKAKVMQITPRTVRILYTNHRGEKAWRTVTPWPYSLSFRKTEHHLTEQWLFDAYDHDKKADRTFALKDIEGWEIPT